jgi:hypothetical protein
MNTIVKETINLSLAFAALGAGLNVFSAGITYMSSDEEHNNVSSACANVRDPLGKILFCSIVPGEKLGGYISELTAK